MGHLCLQRRRQPNDQRLPTTGDHRTVAPLGARRLHGAGARRDAMPGAHDPARLLRQTGLDLGQRHAQRRPHLEAVPVDDEADRAPPQADQPPGHLDVAEQGDAVVRIGVCRRVPMAERLHPAEGADAGDA
jgi:hypothetical protein